MEEEHKTYSVGEYGYGSCWRLSWGAIFCGLFVTLAVFITLQLLGAGIGISTLDVQDTGDNPQAGTLGIGAGIWWFIVGLISLFLGGWVAGHLANTPERTASALHGLVVWSLMYLVMFWLVTTALASLVGGAVGAIGKGISTAGQAATSQQGQQTISKAIQSVGIDPNMIQQSLGQAVGPNTTGQNQNVTKSIQDYLQGDRTPQERQKLVQSVARTTGKTPQEADQMITNMEQKAEQVKAKAGEVKEQAKEAGQKAVKITGGSLIGLAIVMIIGAIVAMLGGVAGAPQDYETEHGHRHLHTHD